MYNELYMQKYKITFHIYFVMQNNIGFHIISRDLLFKSSNDDITLLSSNLPYKEISRKNLEKGSY